MTGSHPLRSSPQATPADSAAPIGAEHALVTRIRAGDREAFRELFEAYHGALRAFVLTHVSSAATAEDLVQDVLFRVWKNRETWVLKTSLRSYLYVAARNAAAIHRRHAQVVERWETDAVSLGETPGMSAEPVAVERQAEQADLAAALDKALLRLPERCRQTVLLRREHDLTYPEIAEVMGVTVKCVEAQFSKALKQLRKDLAAFI